MLARQRPLEPGGCYGDLVYSPKQERSGVENATKRLFIVVGTIGPAGIGPNQNSESVRLKLLRTWAGIAGYAVSMFRAVMAGLLAVVGAAAADLPQHVLNLARVKARVKQALATVPDYTCLAVTGRYRQELKDPAPRPVDVVRMEVAHAEGHDLYAWPGATRFDTAHATELIGSGMYGSGEFASHLTTAFNGYAVVKYAGEEGRLGRRLLRWDYTLAQFASDWHVTYATRTAVAGEQGSFWVDPETLDVVRLEVRADGLPPRFPISGVATTIDYARVRLGTREILLPQSALTILTEGFSGARSFNFTEFSHCRQYTTQSEVSYSASPSSTPEPGGAGLKEITIPATLRVSIALSDAVESRDAAVGDAIEAKVLADVVQKGEVIVPKGAVLRGRLRRMDAQSGPPQHVVVGLEFTDLEFSGRHARFFGVLVGVDSVVPGFRWIVDSMKVTRKRTGRGTEVTTSGTSYRIQEVPGVGTFFMEGSAFRLPQGMAMTWVTQSVVNR